MALDGIAVIVNAENTVADLTLEQIASHLHRRCHRLELKFGSDAGAIAVHRP